MARAKTDEYNYVLDYIKESIEGRKELVNVVLRATKAYTGVPFVNYYKQALSSYGTTLESDKREQYNRMCSSIHEKKNMVVNNAVQTVVSMAMGGASQFQFAPYDKYLDVDSDTIDKQKAAAEHFYDVNKMDSLMPQIVESMCLGGAAYLYIQPDTSDYCQSGSFKVSLIDSYRMLNDPLRNKSNRPRFVGFTQMESWSSIKNSIYKDSKSGYMLKSINEVDVYLNNVSLYINNESFSDKSVEEYISKEVDMFYSSYVKQNKSKKIEDSNKYQGDDVELSYVYDIHNKIFFKVVNRKFIVEAKKNPLSRTISSKYTDTDGKQRTITKTVSIDSPIVEIPFIKNTWESYPVSPLFYVLDDFDSVCSIETIIYHNLSIMAPINFLSSSYDAEIISRATQIAGEFIEGTLSQTGVFSKSHDMSSALAAITRYEERIKRTMGATDQYEIQAMIGNRATASEVSSINGAVSQRLNRMLANIESGMSELTDKFFKMWIIFNNKKLEFSKGNKQSEMEPEEMAADCIVRSKLRSSIKLEQAEQATRAMQLVGFLGNIDVIDKKKFIPDMIKIALNDLVTRERAEEYVGDEDSDSEVKKMIMNRVKESDDYNNGILSDADIANMSPEELDSIIEQLNVSSSQNDNVDMGTTIDKDNQLRMDKMAPGTMPGQAGIIANSQQSIGGQDATQLLM